MEAYTSFASVYDTFMDNVPYREWGEILAGYGYDMIGVDNSEDMLEIAMEKRMESGHDIL